MQLFQKKTIARDWDTLLLPEVFLSISSGDPRIIITREYRKIPNILEIEIRNSKILSKNYLHLPFKKDKILILSKLFLDKNSSE